GLTTDEAYADAVRSVQMFLDGRNRDLVHQLRDKMAEASENQMYEQAGAMRDLIATVEELDQRQKMAAAAGDNTDIFAYYAEPPLAAVNLFHLRNGRIVDRREFFWEDIADFDPAEFMSALVKQVYLNQGYIPDHIHVPAEFEDREVLEEWLTEKRGKKVEIHTPQRGQKKAMLALVENNAQHSFEARFRVMKPTSAAISTALGEVLGLEHGPERIECFDISHIQGTDKVASMVVWEKGRMKKSDYRKFIIKTVVGNDDFASMREVVGRRYARLKEEGQPMPGLILIDGGIGQLHAAAEALESVGVVNVPLASIAKREETLYVLGSEDEPIVLDRFHPVLHLIQTVRDEAHRFAVTFHRQRRSAARLTSELVSIEGVGPKTAQKLLRELGSLDAVKKASEEQLAAVIGPAAARKLRAALGAAVA
ncbi:MAG: excinuclease ABC subunit UvrC, partial [Acidobacteriota bacterium]